MRFSTLKAIALFSCCFLSPTHADTSTHLDDKLPRTIDNTTILKDIRLQDMTVSYHFTLHNLTEEKAIEKCRSMKTIVKRNGCNDPSIQELLNKDLEVNFLYYLENKRILKVKLTKHYCQSFNTI